MVPAFSPTLQHATKPQGCPWRSARTAGLLLTTRPPRGGGPRVPHHPPSPPRPTHPLTPPKRSPAAQCHYLGRRNPYFVTLGGGGASLLFENTFLMLLPRWGCGILGVSPNTTYFQTFSHMLLLIFTPCSPLKAERGVWGSSGGMRAMQGLPHSPCPSHRSRSRCPSRKRAHSASPILDTSSAAAKCILPKGTGRGEGECSGVIRESSPSNHGTRIPHEKKVPVREDTEGQGQQLREARLQRNA